MLVVKLAYLPVGILAGMVGGILAKKAAATIWARFDSQAPDGPPEASDPTVPASRAVVAAAVQAGVQAGVRAAIDRSARGAFRQATGVWPGEAAASD